MYHTARFKLKYHPEDSTKRKEEQYQNLKKRTNLFMEFLESGRFEGASLDSTNSEKLIKLMDWFVIRMEDGTDEDAAKLLSDEPRPRRISTVKQEEEAVIPPVEKKAKENGNNKDDSDGEASMSENETADKNSDEEGETKKRKRSTSKPEVEDDASNLAAKDEDEDKVGSNGEEAGSDDENRPPKKRTKERLQSGGSEIVSGGSEIENDQDGGENKGKDSNGDVVVEKKNAKQGLLPIPGEMKKKEEDELPQLHRTASIFLRNLSPLVTKLEVEAMCKKYPGFMRVAIADPQPDKKFFRRAWVTFKRNVNIKEICWNLNNMRLRDTELGPIVNRDLSRRVRTVNGITPHKMIVRNDIRLAAKVIQHLDSKWNLWDEDRQANDKEIYGVYSTNPVLKNITDYLIEEASAEEEELLGLGSSSDGELDGEGKDDRLNTIERDEELIGVLDRLLFYLRFVHSLDYYNHSEYPYEDEMPNRLGIIHARGMPPTAKVNTGELQEYNRNFEQKISTFVQPIVLLTDEECKLLGTKEDETETEKFITANTQELGKEKWLCPLSGKKFKGPEFVRKHILNKHGDKLEEVIFFNNYLRDPKRPQSPEAAARQALQERPPPPRREPMPERDYPPGPQYGSSYGSGGGYGMMGGQGNYGGGGYGGPRPYGGGGGPQFRDYGPPRGGRPFRMGGRDPGNRGIVSYRDLDAPAEPDDF
ncbi:Serrate RNA effector molecule [Folsomia candida]|uniref:Serrate RNA effector molecule homolog n=1 Tax=Folsomia candida TaxID=158441 RepID=A0A226EMA4_FOLCA|nr:Serrate RNA effector molecule [Folsomia candida]